MTTYPEPGPIANVVTTTDVESTWGNAIRDRVVNNFTTTTQRDTFYASQGGAKVGQAAYCGDIASLLVWAGATDGWQNPWNVPWGVVGVAASNGSNQGSITTTVDVTGGSIGWFAWAHRNYKHTFSMAVSSNLNGEAIDVTITDTSGATTFARKRFYVQDVSDIDVIDFSWLEQGLPTALTTRKLRASGVGLGSCAIQNTTQPLQYFIEDVGPNGLPV